MTEYFYLQFRMANRKMREAGLHPVPGYILLLGGLILSSEILFRKTSFAPFVLILAAISLMIRVSEKRRNDFLQIVFGDQIKKIRIAENVGIAFPFLVLLATHSEYPALLLLLPVTVLLALTTVAPVLNYSLPTPFYKYPFEFAAGFRNTFYIYPLAFLLTITAISVGNYNLGVFSMLLLFLMILGYYYTPENEYYIWIFSVPPGQFLLKKIGIALFYSTMVSLPILIALLISFPERAGTSLLFFFLGLAYITTVLLAKYSAYPNEINLPEVVAIVLSMYFPPLLLILLPYFYSKSLKKLNALLR